MEHGVWSGRPVPGEAPEQAADLGHGEGEQFGGEVVLVRPPEGGPAQRGEVGVRHQHGGRGVAVPAGPGAHLAPVEPSHPSSPASPLAASKRFPMAQRVPATRTSRASAVPSGAWVR